MMIMNNDDVEGHYEYSSNDYGVIALITTTTDSNTYYCYYYFYN